MVQKRERVYHPRSDLDGVIEFIENVLRGL